ncbi:PHP domain-containing protein [Geitlerinema sp. P-1104]|uniref:PHP domain-containing protein n=1 Tax=Geitlerinema sp. P-1104 TaxID=2546230 RepID=UPI0014773673|nr:PHP domain-containing protein [Geitlerinema sp. P-1104]NMG59036.1 PHP domain-containing protein [Geitlerinema sp. P-1104]
MLELHCHSQYSDGTLTPTQLVERAVAAGVKALALTDHDTMSGCQEAAEAAQAYHLTLVPGVELSTVHRGRSLHILGFYPDGDRLKGPLQARLEGRKQRAEAMMQRLQQLGYPIQLPEFPPGVAPSRPHLARALLEAGHVQSWEEAFDRFLGEGRPAYVDYPQFTAEAGITLLRSCAAVPVWAHPYLFAGGSVDEVLPELVDMGLMGLEVYHPHHRRSQREHLQQLSQRYNLVITGGTDYHGPNRGRTAKELNSFALPLTLLEPLEQLAEQLRSPQGGQDPG